MGRFPLSRGPRYLPSCDSACFNTWPTRQLYLSLHQAKEGEAHGDHVCVFMNRAGTGVLLCTHISLASNWSCGLSPCKGDWIIKSNSILCTKRATISHIFHKQIFLNSMLVAWSETIWFIKFYDQVYNQGSARLNVGGNHSSTADMIDCWLYAIQLAFITLGEIEPSQNILKFEPISVYKIIPHRLCVCFTIWWILVLIL